MILRPYQTQAVRAAVDALRQGRRPCLVSPTGSGKTVMGAAVVSALGMPARWTAHRRELIAQARAKLPPTCGVFAVQERRTARAHLLVIDEAHHSTSASYRRHIDAHEGPVLGLTATPFRLDGRGLGEVFDSLLVATTPAALVADGTLVEPRYYSVGSANVGNLRKRAGDFTAEDSAAAMDRPSVIGDAVTEYRERAAGTRAVAFCVTVDHAQHVAAAFRENGVPAEVVSGDMPAGERDAILARLRTGATKVVANCMILTEGWDLPALETAIILRPTASLCLHLQMLGRVMRSAEGKRGATVLDHAGNVLRLGRATDPVAFTLDGCPPRTSSATGLRTCRACYAIYEATAQTCPQCGAPSRVIEEQGALVVDGIGGTERLVELSSEPMPFSIMAGAWEQIERDRVLRNRAIGWSAAQFKARFDQWPIIDERRNLVDPKNPSAAVYEFRRWLSIGKAPRQAFGIVKSRLGFGPPWALVAAAERTGS